MLSYSNVNSVHLSWTCELWQKKTDFFVIYLYHYLFIPFDRPKAGSLEKDQQNICRGFF